MVILSVAGMRNNSCREAVIQALEGVPGVEDVSVSLMRGRAVVRFVPPCEVRALVEAVERVGCVALVSVAGM
jgi:copper chaperone CopZ